MVLGMVTGSVPMLFSLMLMQGITLSMWRSFLDRAIPSYKPGDLRKGLQTTLNPVSSTEAPSPIQLPNLSTFESLNLQEAASSAIKQSDPNSDPGGGGGDNVLQSLQLLSKLDPKMLDLLNKMTTQAGGLPPAGVDPGTDPGKVDSAALLSQLQSGEPVDYAALQQQLANGQFTGPDGVQYVQYDPNSGTGSEGLANDEQSQDGQPQAGQIVTLPDGQQVQYVDVDPAQYYAQQQQQVGEDGQLVGASGEAQGGVSGQQTLQLDPGVRYQYIDEPPGKDSQTTPEEESQLAQYQLTSESVESEGGRERPPFIIGSPIKGRRRVRGGSGQRVVKRRRKVRRRPSRLSSLFRAKRETKNNEEKKSKTKRKNIPVINVEMKPRKKSKDKKKEKKAKNKYVVDKDSLLPASSPTNSPTTSPKPKKIPKKSKKRRFVKYNPKKNKNRKHKNPMTMQTSESNRIQVLVPSTAAVTQRLISLQSKRIQIDDTHIPQSPIITHLNALPLPSTSPPSTTDTPPSALHNGTSANNSTNCSFRRLPESGSHQGMSLLWNDRDGWSKPAYGRDCSNNSPTDSAHLAQTTSGTSIGIIGHSTQSTSTSHRTKAGTRIYRGRIPPPEAEFETFPPVNNQRTVPRIPQNTTDSSTPEVSPISSQFRNVSQPEVNQNSTESSSEMIGNLTTTEVLPSINVTCSPANESATSGEEKIKLPENIVINLINNLRSKSQETSTSSPSTTTMTTTTTISSTSQNPLSFLLQHLHEQQQKEEKSQQLSQKSSATIEAINEIQNEEFSKEQLISQKDILSHVLSTINSKQNNDFYNDNDSDIRQQPAQKTQNPIQKSNRKSETPTTKNELFRQDILKHVLAAINASQIDGFDLHQMNKPRPTPTAVLTLTQRRKQLLPVTTSTGKRVKTAVVEIENEGSSEEDDGGDDSMETEMVNNSNRFKRVCYYLLNGGKDGQLDVDSLQLHICSHLIVGYAKVHPNGLVVAEKPLEDTEK